MPKLVKQHSFVKSGAGIFRIVLSATSVMALILYFNGERFSEVTAQTSETIEEHQWLSETVQTLEHTPAVDSASIIVDQLAQTSLATTQVDRAHIGFDGHTITVNQTLRFYFEYFIVLQNELGRDAIQRLLASDAAQAYPAPVADYVVALFARYLHYLDSIEAMNEVALSTEDTELSEQLKRKVELQQQWFEEVEILALFDNHYLDSYDHNDSLQEHYRAYSAQRQRSPSDDPAALRMELFGMEASARFNELDQQRQQWQQKLEDYQCQRKMLDAAQGLAKIDREGSLQSLRQRLFNTHEIKRVVALEKHQLMPANNSC